MTDAQPDGVNHVISYTDWLASSLARYESLARSLVAHKAEKGRIVESVVKGALRNILPKRFSIGTGFAITGSGRTSPQLDIVIYDELTNAPVILEGGIGLFPIESIYGFVEVKSTLDRKEIKRTVGTIKTVRSFSQDKRFVGYGVRDIGGGRKVADEVEFCETIAPRSFVFAINSDYKEIENLVTSLKDSLEENEAHLHGLTTVDKNWFIRQEPTFGEKPYRFHFRKGRAFEDFYAAFLRDVQSMNMYPASMKRYLKLDG